MFIPPPNAAVERPHRVLFIGKPTPDFMVIINALRARKAEVVAAFTTFSAFDYLHERDFDVVVMNALENSEPALTIGETMRRNSRLFHIPTLVLVNETVFRDHDLAFSKGVHDIISTKSSEGEIASRVLEHASYHRMHSQLEREFKAINHAPCLDEKTGLFNAEFFKKHLRRVHKDAKQNDIPLSIVTLRAAPKDRSAVADEYIEAATHQIGSLIRDLVRMQDITARLDRDIFAIAFPALSKSSLVPIIERITGIADCAAFESGSQDNSSFTMTLHSASVELKAGESSDALINRALLDLVSPRNKTKTLKVKNLEKSA